jgi:hypothetical protein
MAQAWLVFSVPEVVVLAGLLDSEPVVWVGLTPSGDFSGIEAGALGVLGLLLVPVDAGAVGLLDNPEPGVELPDVPETGVAPPALIDVPEPPAKPCPGVLELLVPEPAMPETLPLELLVLEFPGALPPALVDETPGLEFV